MDCKGIWKIFLIFVNEFSNKTRYLAVIIIKRIHYKNR